MSDWCSSKCGKALDVTEEAPRLPRRPCPCCGSTARTANASVHVSASARVYLKTHAKHREGGRKVVREEYAGDDYHRKTGKWNVMRRLIDRVNDLYEEIFRDRDTGEIIHETREPLSKHRRPPKSETTSENK